MRALSILGAVAILADSAPSLDAEAEGLLRQAVAAQGSDSAIAAVRSLTAVADCTGPSGDYKTFKTEVVSLLPDRTMFRQTAAGRTTELFVAGDKGWLRSSAEEPPQPLPAGLIGVVRGHEFHFLFLDLVQRNRHPRLSGRDTVEGKPCLIVEASDSGGRPTSVCIDEKTKLPLRVSYEPSGGPKPQTIHVIPSGWIEIAGVRWIDGFTLRQGEEVFTYRYTSIRPNSVDPKMFEVPAGLASTS